MMLISYIVQHTPLIDCILVELIFMVLISCIVQRIDVHWSFQSLENKSPEAAREAHLFAQCRLSCKVLRAGSV